MGCVFHSLPPDPKQDGIALGLFFGIARIGQRLLLGPTRIVAGSDHAAIEPEGHGQYLLLRHNAGPNPSLRLHADALGMSPLFWAERNGSVYIGSQIHLLVLAMKAAGESISLNLGAVAAQWFADLDFTLQATSRSTLVTGVSMTLPGEGFTLTQGCVIRHRPAPTNWSALTRDDYWGLVHEGVADIRANVLAAVNSGMQVTATLSGGRDTRMIFAALVSLELEKEVPIFSYFTFQSDIEISSALVDMFGAKYLLPGKMTAMNPQTPEGWMANHRSTYLGVYNDMRWPSHKPEWADPQIRLVGGSGEIYRSFYPKMFPPEFLNRPFDAQALRAMVNLYPDARYLPSQVHEAAIEELLPAFAEIEGPTLEHRMDRHFMLFQNRMHFGISPSMQQPSDMIFHPLSSPALVQLSQRIDLGMHRANRIVFDVTREMCEILPYLPYDSKGPAYHSAQFQRPSRFDGMQPKLTPKLEQFKAMDLARKALIGENAQLDYAPALNQSVAESLEVLRNHDAIAPFLPGTLTKRLDWLKATNNKFYRVWAMRLAAVKDVLDLV
jgi:hypothetical protein